LLLPIDIVNNDHKEMFYNHEILRKLNDMQREAGEYRD